MRILVFAIAFLFSFSLSAQESKPLGEDSDRSGNNALGVAVGSTSAYGISYRRYIKRFAGQVTFAPIKTENDVQYHFGLVFLYNLVENRRTNFFVYQSNYFYHKTETLYNYNTWPEPPQEYESTTEYWNHGLGLGFEFLIAKVVSLNLMGGYGAYENFERIGIAGELGLYYRF